MGSRQCEVCKDAQSKYKCPSCLVPYCSLACFKKHKEIPCKKSLPLVPHVEASFAVPRDRSLEVDNPSCILNNKQLLSIVESDEIRGLLADVNLQKLIQKIDSSQDQENELDRAMEGQMFRNFTDKVLTTVNPPLLIHKKRRSS